MDGFSVESEIEVDGDPRDRLRLARKPAFMIRLELVRLDEDGRRRLVDRILSDCGLANGTRDLAAWALVDEANVKVAKWVHQRADFLLWFAAAEGLTNEWDPDETEIHQRAVDAVRAACAAANVAHEASRVHLAGRARAAQRLAAAVGADAESRLAASILAELARTGMPPAGHDDDAVAAIVALAEQRLVARHVVIAAVLERRAAEADAARTPEMREAAEEAWAAALSAVVNPFVPIDERPEPEGAGVRPEPGALGEIALRKAAEVGDIHFGLLTAMLRVTLASYKRKRKDAERAIRALPLPYDPLTDPDRPSGNAALEGAGASSAAAAHTTAVYGVVDDGSELVASLVEQVGPGGFARSQFEPDLPLTTDIVRLLRLCEEVTRGDSLSKLPIWYRPVSRSSTDDFFWPLCQAVRPHHVVWPGYLWPSDRQRSFVSSAREEFRALAATTVARAFR